MAVDVTPELIAEMLLPEGIDSDVWLVWSENRVVTSVVWRFEGIWQNLPITPRSFNNEATARLARIRRLANVVTSLHDSLESAKQSLNAAVNERHKCSPMPRIATIGTIEATGAKTEIPR